MTRACNEARSSSNEAVAGRGSRFESPLVDQTGLYSKAFADLVRLLEGS
jgi:hypothetical protein